MAKLTVKDVDLKGKKVLVRVDFNVPVKDGVITNDNRITAALPTIKYILEQGGRAILFSHLGRVKEEADKEGKSLAPVAADLAAKLGQDVKFIPGVTRGAELEAAINATEIHTPKCPVYQNVDALPHTDPEEIKKNLVAQLTASVRWTQTVKNMVADGATDFTECGPGAVLQGLIKKIAPEVSAHGIA